MNIYKQIGIILASNECTNIVARIFTVHSLNAQYFTKIYLYCVLFEAWP